MRLTIASLVLLVLPCASACGSDSDSDDDGGGGATDATGDDTGDGGSGDDGGGTGDDTGDDTGGGEDEPEVHDGSRLVIRWLQPTSGPDQVIGLFDDVLGVACSIRAASDGVLRCLPSSDASGTHVQAPAATRVPYVHGNESCAPAYVVVDDETSGFDCEPPRFTVHAVDDARADVCDAVTDGLCTSVRTPGDDAPSGSRFYLAGDPIDPEAFVAAEIVVGDGDTRVRRRFIETDDGARLGWDLFDTELELSCTFRPAADGSIRCLPVATNEGWGFFGLPGAWDTAPYRRGNTSCPPAFVEAPDTPGSFSCDDTLYALLEASAPTDEVCLQLTGESCSSTLSVSDDAPAGAAFYAGGTEVDPGMFARADLDTEGDDRIVSRVHETEDGLRVPYGLRDTELGIDCAYAADDASDHRCLPLTAATGSHYVLLTQQWEPYRPGNSECAPPFLTRAHDHSIFSCEPRRTEVLAIGGKIDEVCVATAGAQCNSWSMPSDDAPAGAGFYVAGDPVDPQQFDRATL